MRKLANRVSPVMLALTNRNTDVHISTAFCVYASKSSCQDGVVGIVTRLGARRSGFEFPTVSSIFFYTVSGKHLPSFSVGKRVLARVHRPGHQVHNSHIYSDEVKNNWSTTSTHPIRLVAWTEKTLPKVSKFSYFLPLSLINIPQEGTPWRKIIFVS